MASGVSATAPAVDAMDTVDAAELPPFKAAKRVATKLSIR
jgi:hypothetical protein